MDTTSGITERERALLLKPFPLKQHEWHRGYVYVQERAINARLAQVDASFHYEIVHYEHRSIQASCHARLIILGVARDAIGMQAVVKAKDGVGEVGEPEKSADTDAFKRCARKHGVGLYLLDSPGEQAFEGWLLQQMAAWERAYGHLFNKGDGAHLPSAIAAAQERNASLSPVKPVGAL